MVAKAIRGQGVAHTPGAGGASASWRGVSLQKTTLESWQSIDPGDSAACIFDANPYDSDGFLSVGPHTFSPITVPTGSAAVIPVGLSGLYRVSFTSGVGIPPDPDGYAFSTTPVVNGTSTDYTSTQSSKNVDGIGYMAEISPGLVRLAEGDVVWQILNNISTGAVVTVISQSWLLLEYLMPWPLEGT